MKGAGGKRARERGSVAVEFALVLPMLCLLVIGGWVLGYMAYAKVALSMVANRAARDFAAAPDQHAALDDIDQAYRYDGGFAESFGLPRWGVHALIMKTKVGAGEGPADHAVTVATCFRLPFSVPFIGEAGEEEAEKTAALGPNPVAAREVAALLAKEARPKQPPAAGGGGRAPSASLSDEALEWLAEQAGFDYRQLWDEAATEAAEWERLWHEGKGLYERGEEIIARGGWAAELFTELLEGPTPDFTPYDVDGADGPEGMEAAVRTLCEPPESLRDGSLIVTARSAYLLQEIYEP